MLGQTRQEELFTCLRIYKQSHAAFSKEHQPLVKSNNCWLKLYDKVKVLDFNSVWTRTMHTMNNSNMNSCKHWDFSKTLTRNNDCKVLWMLLISFKYLMGHLFVQQMQANPYLIAPIAINQTIIHYETSLSPSQQFIPWISFDWIHLTKL